MLTAVQNVVVVGASLAGLRACETVRSEGFLGRVALVGAEDEVPYDRPPLSKKLLAGEWEADRIRLRKADDFAALDLDLHLGRRAVELRLTDQRVVLDDGTQLPYDGLVIATGASPRRLPGQPDVDGVVELRTLADSLDLRARLAGGARVTVVGAGFIGLEVAATARLAGCEVTVLEGAPAPLMRGLGAEMGAAVAAVHREHGVDLRCGVRIEAIEASGGRLAGVRLADGELIASDVVVVGIGVTPATAWLEGSGIELRDGVVCDEILWTGAPGVYAAGDCARWPNRIFDGHDDVEMRVEHWTNAAEQGAVAARNLLALAQGREPVAYESVPFFWSDQFDRRIQFVGRAHGDDDLHVFTGEPTGAFAALYGWRGRLRGVLGVNKPKQVMPFRALVAARTPWDEAIEHAERLVGPSASNM
jgi:NADPH-dependent 2,4-dienoyl-CoA reductase/sulfur reductase-like enzyme